jgi:hypothetical protein
MDQKFTWTTKDQKYEFKSGTLDVKCRGPIRRFYIKNYDRHNPTTVIFATDTYDCLNMAQKQFQDFMVLDQKIIDQKIMEQTD